MKTGIKSRDAFTKGEKIGHGSTWEGHNDAVVCPLKRKCLSGSERRQGLLARKKVLPQKSSLKIKIYLQNPVYTFFDRRKDKSIANAFYLDSTHAEAIAKKAVADISLPPTDHFYGIRLAG